MDPGSLGDTNAKGGVTSPLSFCLNVIIASFWSSEIAVLCVCITRFASMILFTDAVTLSIALFTDSSMMILRFWVKFMVRLFSKHLCILTIQEGLGLLLGLGWGCGWL